MRYCKYTCGIWYEKDHNYTYKFNVSILFMCYVLQAINVAQHLTDRYDILTLHTTAEHKVELTCTLHSLSYTLDD